VTPGGQISHYPAWDGSQSQLRLACVFKSETGSSQVTPNFTIHDFNNVIYHNGAARSVTEAGAGIASGVNTFTVTDCTSIGAYVNRSITTADNAPGLAARTTVLSVGGGCTITLNKNTNAAMPAGQVFKIENSIVRSINDGVTVVGTNLNSPAQANFTAADVGLSVSGTNIPGGTTIVGFVDANNVTMNNAATAAGAAQTITIGGTHETSSARRVNDATFTATNQITSTAANWISNARGGDPGLRVSGTGITQPCYVASVAGTVATLSSACNDGSAGTKTVVIGEASATAPANGEPILHQGVQLDLNPTLVPGSNPCTSDDAEGFNLGGTWQNPDGTLVGGAFATQPAGTRTLGQIQFKTAVITYAAYIIERPAAVVGDPIGTSHYDIVFPNVPTGLALCGSATSPGLGYSLGIDAATPSVSSLPTGTGRPGTAQFRSTRDNNNAGGASTAFLRDDSGNNFYTGANFQRLCIIPAGKPTVDFKCGTG
jgi:hypothetical protein